MAYDHISPYLGNSISRAQLIWKVNRRSYVLSQTVTLLMTLSDPNHLATPHYNYFIFWVIFVSLEQANLESSNLVHRFTTAISSL